MFPKVLGLFVTGIEGRGFFEKARTFPSLRAI
jgi:hypothetical protein